MSAYEQFLQETKSAPSSGGSPKVVPPEVGNGGQPDTPATSAYQRFQQETKTTPPSVVQSPVVKPVVSAPEITQVVPENTSTIKKVSNFLSDWLINKPINALGKKLYETNPQYFNDVTTGIDINKQEGKNNTGEEILKTIQQGQRAISGLTGGIITPKTEAPENVVSKIYGGFSEAIGSVVALQGIGKGLSALTDTPAITSYLSKNPLVYKYALPFVQNAVGFSLYGQLDPNLGNNVGERFKKLGLDIATSVPYTLLGGVKNPKISIPASFTLGFGMAKLSGASNEDAFISGVVLGGLDAYSRLGGEGAHFTDGRAVEKKLTIESLNILNKYSETKLTPKSSPEEIKKAFLAGAKATHPDKTNGMDIEFKKVNSAYQFLSPKGSNISVIEKPKAGEVVPTETPANIPKDSVYGKFLIEKGVDLTKPAIEIQKAIESIPKTTPPQTTVPVTTPINGNEAIPSKPTEVVPNTNIEENKGLMKGEISAKEMGIVGKSGAFYRVSEADDSLIQGLHGKRFSDAVKEGKDVTVYRAGKPNETLKSGTFLTADIKTAKAYLKKSPDKNGFGGTQLYKYKVSPKDLVSVDNMDFSELIFKPVENNENKLPAKAEPKLSKGYLRTVTGDTVDIKKLSDPEYFVKAYESTFARGGTDEKLYKILTKEFVPAGREASGFLADKYNEAKKSLVESKPQEKLPKQGIKNASVGKFREELKSFVQEARESKTVEEFINRVRGSATQYGKYNPEIRLGGSYPESKRLSELGIDPEEIVTIYRGIDDTTGKIKKQINDGDFVTVDYESALAYASGEKNVVSKEVKAKDLFLESDEKDFLEDPFFTGSEYIYSTKQKVKAYTDKELTDIYNQVKEKSIPKSGTVGASIGKYREEGGKGSEVILGNYDQVKPIEFPELLSLAKDLSGSEVFIKKYAMANGMFYSKDKRIGLNPDLFKAGNLQQLQKTMAHEIGHLIDYLPEGTLARGNVLGRLSVLRDFNKDFYEGSGTTRTNPELKKELWNLSKYWKPIDEETASKGFLNYRKSPAEVYADFISVIFNNPKLAGEMAPSAYNLFFKTLDAKPEVKSAYFELQDILRNGEKVAEMRKDKTQNMFTTADQISKDRQHQIELEEEQKKKSLWFLFKFQAVSRFESFREKVKALEKKGIYVNPDDNPVYFLEESNYLGGKIKAEVDTRFNTIYQELLNNGLSWDDLGEITFYERILKGDRAEVANPEGLQIDFVQELYDGFEGVAPDPENNKKGVFSMKSQLGEEKFSKLQQLAVQYRSQIKELYKEAYDAGLIPKATWNMIKKNDYYVPFKPIKYSGTKTSYRIKSQKGTLHAIENPANTGIEKSVSLIRAVEKNKVNKASIDFLQKYYPSELTEANYAFNGKTRIALEPLDKNMRLVRYMDKGKMKAYYVDQYIGEALQKTPVGHSNMIIEGLRFMNSGLFRPLFITFNLGFQSFNFVRDMTRFWKNVPDVSFLKTIKLYSQSARGAKVRAFGLPKNSSKADKEAYDLINKLEEDRVLSITYNDLIKGEDVEDKQIDRIMRETGVRQSESTKLGTIATKFGISKKTPVIKQIVSIMDFIEKTGNLIESMPKIAGYYALKDKMAPAEMRSYVRRKVGSPDFLDGGKFKPAMNEIFLFSNAIFQGIRSDYETATDPKTRSGYWWKTTQANIIPKLLMILAVAGVFGDDIKKLFGKISEYDKTNYVIIPFGEDNNGKATYIRIPHDETGRIVSGLFWKIASAIRDPKKLTDTETYTNILAYAGGQAPSISPAVSSVYNVGTFLSGQNPYDFFRGRNVLTDEQMIAGGVEKIKPFMSYMFDNLGGATFTKLYTNEVVPKTPTLSERVLGLPIVSNVAGRWIKSSNYGETEQLKAITSEVDQKKAREALQNRRTVFDAVDKAQGKSYAEANKIKMDMIKSIVGAKIDTPEKRSLVQSLGNRFEKLRVRGSADTRVDALITAKSNEAKVALLKEFSTSMSTNDFNDLKKFIIKNRVVSSEAYQQFLRESHK